MSLSLEELLNVEISVASNVVTELRKQPTSITTITADTIRLSGARTLNELLTIYVPGYFLVEDQDDTIAGFRGVVPDNNSKTMLLLNGESLNTEWFWGAPDVLLNGINMEMIERIEVIRGPGSVTLGQGALLGVINIVTRQPDKPGATATLKFGQHGYRKISTDMAYFHDDTKAYLFLSKGDYDGQTMSNRGWAQTRIDQGLSVYQRNHHLKRNEHQSLFANLSHQRLDIDLYHFEHQRDLYNFYRDREVVKQTITGISAHYQQPLSDTLRVKVSANYTQDDYQLFSHGNNVRTIERFNFEAFGSQFAPFVEDGSAAASATADDMVTPGLKMGGTGEIRRGVTFLLNWDEPLPNHRVALGAEYVNYNFGRTDADGRNYILNEEIQLLGFSSDGAGGFIRSNALNQSNTWVKPASISIRSVFLEDIYQFSDTLDFFAAVRFDDHPNWGEQFSPRIGALYDINNRHLFRFTWQTGFRGAVGVQFAGGFVQDGLLAQTNFAVANEWAESNGDFDFDGIAGNNIKQLTPVEPETIESIELSYQYSQESLQINSIIFYNTFEDILAAEANGWIGLQFGDKIGTDDIGTWGGNWYYQNQTGKLTQHGIELDIRYQYDNLLVSASHSHVSVVNADDGVIGGYVLPGNKVAAYPENISRLHVDYAKQLDVGQLSLKYEHVYFWQYYAPTGNTIDGGHIANLGISLRLPSLDNLEISAVLKNIWQEDALYPINGTGDLLGADGTPSIESRHWWMALSYAF
ncbi:TonB-dependent receptor plug domain-containing protein [Aestuariibacter salexigens]|uniref:TonB-dependent receptor plug domain-containing protein n=1 Tax=Aestuariibacter salexigens TaxID=226010 RepID=UPI00146FAADA|nr:TonB-dependent receptor [Aestuariibacter salexigens]